MVFTEENKKRVDEEKKRYPLKQSALIPALHVAQEQFGYLSEEVMQYVATEMDIPLPEVQAVATFYTMFQLRPKGRHHIQVCQNLSCAMFGAESLIDYLERKHGVRAGEVTADGRFFDGARGVSGVVRNGAGHPN
ncbi:MAG: NAD(P)H-dependent oxidoreductase subunit E [Deltaproteobacteria bacterium]|nr:NAD(P)H-dependent oxidoreductase subunit E [Deltaproteobacteria bacterium]